jgi:hypothetical protein
MSLGITEKTQRSVRRAATDSGELFKMIDQWTAERQRDSDQADKTLASILSTIVTHVGFLGFVVQDLASDAERSFSTIDDALLLLRRR